VTIDEFAKRVGISKSAAIFDNMSSFLRQVRNSTILRENKFFPNNPLDNPQKKPYNLIWKFMYKLAQAFGNRVYCAL